MNKEFVPYEQAIALKELGFNKSCFAFYHTENQINLGYCINGFQDNTTLEIKCTAPLWQQVSAWFRDTHLIFHTINHESIGSDEWVFTYEISYLPKEHWDAKRRIPYFKSIDSFNGGGATYSGGWETFEETQLACLKQLIELVKPHNENT